ncbi:phosphoribosyltransferase [Streptomyces longispororuber]|uniref:phosphoribosyltransferase n=1 Tax=Streptomyces longispororuber TaxID=68230 RepID=UPI00210B49C3|nr:phosphoribosyltransferase family protein [Streptomyces longispororuber]MCQ4205652.1 phosphoribosyltransferase [Streptomyces longispororuber]
MMVFTCRTAAGRCLAQQVAALPRWTACRTPRAVFGIARGGVPVAAEVAHLLGAPLDIVVVRKVTAPGNPGLTVGAMAEDGTLVCTGAFLRRFAADSPRLPELARETESWLARQAHLLRGRHEALGIRGGDVVLVDDAACTGASAHAALKVLRHRGAASLVLALPGGSPEALGRLRPSVDEIVCLEALDTALDSWYVDQNPVSDREIVSLLETHRTAVGR